MLNNPVFLAGANRGVKYMNGLVIALIVGGIAGWLAGRIMKSGSQGLILNIVIGIIGGVLGGWLFGLAGVSIASGIINSVITATFGAVILLYVFAKLKKS